jgi:DedD protein
LEQAVKQRLVGAAVLTALAVITLPMIFDTERPPGVQVQETMPPAPEYPAVAMPEPKPVELPADRPTADPVPVSDMYAMNNDQQADADSVPATPATTSSAATPAVANPKTASSSAASLPPLPAAPGGKLDASGIPESWVVQVAAMSDRSKADALIAKLKLNGYAAFAHTTHDSAGDTIRVFVGPKIDRAQAVKIKQKIDREMSLQTMVKPFSPK